jgi:DNA-binding GntR family transcriptional regulator
MIPVAPPALLESGQLEVGTGLPCPSGTPVPPVKILREFIRDTLLDRITRGQLQSGQRVVEITLVREFAVSATPVRKATRELAAMSVLEVQKNKGSSGRQIRLHEIIESFQVRTRLTMDCLQSADPVAIAREHFPIVDGLDSGNTKLAADLLASHSNHLVEFLQSDQHLRLDSKAIPVEEAAR